MFGGSFFDDYNETGNNVSVDELLNPGEIVLVGGSFWIELLYGPKGNCFCFFLFKIVHGSSIIE